MEQKDTRTIQAELARIQSDYEFVCSGLTW